MLLVIILGSDCYFLTFSYYLFQRVLPLLFRQASSTLSFSLVDYWRIRNIPSIHTMITWVVLQIDILEALVLPRELCLQLFQIDLHVVLDKGGCGARIRQLHTLLLSHLLHV